MTLSGATYILIQAEPGTDASELTEQVKRVPGVTRADHVRGPFDVIAEVEDLAVDVPVPSAVSAIDEIEGVLRAIPLPIVSRSEASEPGAVSPTGAWSWWRHSHPHASPPLAGAEPGFG